MSIAALLFGVLALSGCATGGSTVPSADTSAAASLHALSGGGGGGGGGNGSGPQLPPPSLVDGPSIFVANISSALGFAPTVDFGVIVGQTSGAMAIGSSRTAQLLVYNTSKKTPLTITSISVVGPNAGDFAVTSSFAKIALTTAIAKGGGLVGLPVTFTPSAAGVRTGTLQLISNAGTTLIPLTGTGLPAGPVLVTNTGGAIIFTTGSAQQTITISNGGSQALSLTSGGITGPNAASFQFVAANRGQGNCTLGVLIAPNAFCFFGIALAPGATAPATAALTLVTNDPLHPQTVIPITLTP